MRNRTSTRRCSSYSAPGGSHAQRCCLSRGFRGSRNGAYAGAFFSYSGAAASHALVGDGPGIWMAPLVFGALTVASWALRPRERRLVSEGAETGTTLVAWTVPIVIGIVMLVAALLTLPKDPSPF